MEDRERHIDNMCIICRIILDPSTSMQLYKGIQISMYSSTTFDSNEIIEIQKKRLDA